MPYARKNKYKNRGYQRVSNQIGGQFHFLQKSCVLNMQIFSKLQLFCKFEALWGFGTYGVYGVLRAFLQNFLYVYTGKVSKKWPSNAVYAVSGKCNFLQAGGDQ